MQGARIPRTFIVAACVAALGVVLAAGPALAQTGQVRGRVVDAKNQPVEGATVLIEATDGMGRKFQVKTNRRGEYVQIGLPPGQYRLTAQKDKLSESTERRISLDMAEINFTLHPGSASGVSADAQKQAEARITAIKTSFSAGVAASNEGRHDEAIARFNEVLKEAPKCVECHTNIAAVHMQKKDYEAAEAAYKAAIAVDPNSVEAYNGLANIYNAQKKFDLAEEAGAQAQKLAVASGGAGGATTMFNQGVIAWNAGKIPEAKKAFEQAVKLDPNLADAHYWLGMANLNEGNLPEGATHFDAYLKLAPSGQYAEQAKGILSQIKK